MTEGQFKKSMKRRLTINDLAPYLPYDLNITFEADEHSHKMVGLDLSEVHLISPFGDFGRAKIEHAKPLLRPLESLTKKIIWKDVKVSPVIYIRKYLTDNTKLNEWDIDHSLNYLFERKMPMLHFPFVLIDLLAQFHCDIFWLLDAGLALPIQDA